MTDPGNRLTELLTKIAGDSSKITTKDILIALSYEFHEIGQRIVKLEEDKVDLLVDKIDTLEDRMRSLERKIDSEDYIKKGKKETMSLGWKIVLGIMSLSTFVLTILKILETAGG